MSYRLVGIVIPLPLERMLMYEADDALTVFPYQITAGERTSDKVHPQLLLGDPDLNKGVAFVGSSHRRVGDIAQTTEEMLHGRGNKRIFNPLKANRWGIYELIEEK